MLLLASKSPRRRELLKMLDLPFEIVEVRNVEEVYPDDLEVEKVPEYLSRIKAAPYLPDLKEDDILITADTVVILDNEIIGKPRDERQAEEMLKRLSGRIHRVVTGMTFTSPSRSHSFSVITEVEFSKLTDEEIKFYVERYKPLDKAGAYGIQEWIGAIGVAGIKGSFYNVMGLPVHRLYKEILSFGKAAR